MQVRFSINDSDQQHNLIYQFDQFDKVNEFDILSESEKDNQDIDFLKFFMKDDDYYSSFECQIMSSQQLHEALADSACLATVRSALEFTKERSEILISEIYKKAINSIDQIN